jgi:4-amino-4-deoxy-L-arabinose transferase-like glycosyltransferase
VTTDARLAAGPRLAALRRRRIAAPRWTAGAWWAIAATAAFILVSCWWLSRDRGVPHADNGSHLITAVAYRDMLAAGDLGELWTRSGFYPPLTFVVGALGMLVGGLNAAAPVVAQNLVYVPLLAVGCYGVGTLLAGPTAGALAVLFALGTPLLVEQFHVFMLDAPLAALVAVSVWLILRSDRFARAPTSALAGIAVGAGLSSKEQFPQFVVGLLLVVLLRGGWRNRRGLAAFAGAALLVGLPWYVANLGRLGILLDAASGVHGVPPEGRPPLLSMANLTWYAWATLNGLLFAPLTAFATVGVASAAAGLVRDVRRRVRVTAADVRPELLGGLACAWVVLTAVPHNDMRYTMPLVVYLATLGTAWVLRLAPAPRAAATGALLLAVLAATLGASFGVGGVARITLADEPYPPEYRYLLRNYGVPSTRQVTLYANRGFMVTAPRRETDLPGLLAALREHGYTGVGWIREQAILGDPAFDLQGLWLLVRFARLDEPALTLRVPWDMSDPRHALLVRQALPAETRPCLVLADGSGLWVVVDGGRDHYCREG